MGFPFHPRTTLLNDRTERYFSYNSGGENFQKHISDLAEIQQLRSSRDLEEIANLEDIMWQGGLRVVRTRKANHVADIVGYAAMRQKDRGMTLKVEDIWVNEEHRNRGIGNFLLGKLLVSRPHDIRPVWLDRQIIGRRLVMGDALYKLPGIVLTVTEGAGSQRVPEATLNDFYKEIPSDWTGLMVSRKPGSYSACQYENGKVVANFHRWNKRWLWSEDTSGAQRLYDHVVFASTEALNSQQPPRLHLVPPLEEDRDIKRRGA